MLTQALASPMSQLPIRRPPSPAPATMAPTTPAPATTAPVEWQAPPVVPAAQAKLPPPPPPQALMPSPVPPPPAAAQATTATEPEGELTNQLTNPSGTLTNPPGTQRPPSAPAAFAAAASAISTAVAAARRAEAWEAHLPSVAAAAAAAGPTMAAAVAAAEDRWTLEKARLLSQVDELQQQHLKDQQALDASSALVDMLRETHAALLTSNEHLLAEIDELKVRHAREAGALHANFAELAAEFDRYRQAPGATLSTAALPPAAAASLIASRTLPSRAPSRAPSESAKVAQGKESAPGGVESTRPSIAMQMEELQKELEAAKRRAYRKGATSAGAEPRSGTGTGLAVGSQVTVSLREASRIRKGLACSKPVPVLPFRDSLIRDSLPFRDSLIRDSSVSASGPSAAALSSAPVRIAIKEGKEN